MANGSVVQGFLNSIAGYLTEEGIVPDEARDAVTGLLSSISTVVPGVTLGVDPYGVITVDGVGYTGIDDISVAVDEASQSAVLSNYFLGESVEYGVLSSGTENVQALITLLQACTSLDFTATSEGTIHTLTNANFCIDIYEYDVTKDPIQKANIVLRCGPMQNQSISVLADSSNRGVYLKYQITQSSTGDALVKVIATNDATPIDDYETGDALFADVGFAYYEARENDAENVTPWSSGYGGFAIIELQPEGPGIVSYSDEKPDIWGFALMSIHGAPLFVGTSISPSISRLYAHNNEMQPTITYQTSDDKMHLAPIYAPSCLMYTSKYARFGIMTNRSGTYEFTYGNEGTYRYDHGFCVRVI